MANKHRNRLYLEIIILLNFMEYEKHSPDFDYLIKILIDGLLGVGKTSLISQYVEEDIELAKHPSINFKLLFLILLLQLFM